MKKYFIGAIVVAALVLVAIVLLRDSGNSSTVTSTKPTKLYVAMGDSVAAGVGLKDDSDASACNRTNQAYPNQVAATLHYTVKNLACSGATLSAGILGKQDVNNLLVTSQLQQLFLRPKPDLVTLTIGANDAHWTSLLTKCYTAVCGTTADQAAVVADLATVSSNIRSALTQIQAHYGSTPPRVIVTGYHQVFPSANVNVSNCSDVTGIDAAELAWGRQLQSSIDETIKQATSSFSFVSFAAIQFAGHELCTPDSWVQGLADKQPYHPTQAGQAAFARSIIQMVKAFK